MEQEIRKEAVKKYLKGQSPKSIYTDLGRSKNWFFKWLKRYQTGDPDWYKGKSRAPVNRATQLRLWHTCLAHMGSGHGNIMK